MSFVADLATDPVSFVVDLATDPVSFVVDLATDPILVADLATDLGIDCSAKNQNRPLQGSFQLLPPPGRAGRKAMNLFAPLQGSFQLWFSRHKANGNLLKRPRRLGHFECNKQSSVVSWQSSVGSWQLAVFPKNTSKLAITYALRLTPYALQLTTDN